MGRCAAVVTDLSSPIVAVRSSSRAPAFGCHRGNLCLSPIGLGKAVFTSCKLIFEAMSAGEAAQRRNYCHGLSGVPTDCGSEYQPSVRQDFAVDWHDTVCGTSLSLDAGAIATNQFQRYSGYNWT